MPSHCSELATRSESGRLLHREQQRARAAQRQEGYSEHVGLEGSTLGSLNKLCKAGKSKGKHHEINYSTASQTKPEVLLQVAHAHRQELQLHLGEEHPELKLSVVRIRLGAAGPRPAGRPRGASL